MSHDRSCLNEPDAEGACPGDALPRRHRGGRGEKRLRPRAEGEDRARLPLPQPGDGQPRPRHREGHPERQRPRRLHPQPPPQGHPRRLGRAAQGVRIPVTIQVPHSQNFERS